MSIESKCNKIITAARQYNAKRLDKQAAQERRDKSRLPQITQELLHQIYRKIGKNVYNGFGNNFEGEYYFPHASIENQEIQLEIQKTSGLIFTSFTNDYFQRYITVKRTNQIKAFRSGRLVFDFPKLAREDDLRAMYWNSHLPEIANAWLEKCFYHLSLMPNLFYGIPEKINIVDERNRTAFADDMPFGDLELPYANLTSQQINELTDTINRRLSHGVIKIEHSDTCLWVSLIKAPDKTINDATFDYADFYRQYEEVTPQLQAIFDSIAKHIELIPEEEQYLKLCPDYRLVYYFSSDEKETWRCLSRYVVGTKRMNAFTATIEKFYPGITVTNCAFLNKETSWQSPRGCAHGVITSEERVELTFKINSLYSEVTFRMLTIETKIAYFKNYDYTETAHLLAEDFLDYALKYIEERIESQQNRPDYYSTPPLLDGPLDLLDNFDRPDQLYVHIDHENVAQLTKVSDSDFLQKISQTIFDLTDGLISVSFKNNSAEFEVHV